MRPRTQKQPQVKKELCRVLDDVDVDVDVKNKEICMENVAGEQELALQLLLESKNLLSSISHTKLLNFPKIQTHVRRPRTQKQPQVKKELCRVLDDVDVDVDVKNKEICMENVAGEQELALQLLLESKNLLSSISHTKLLNFPKIQTVV